jgi:hypothetical protein
LLESPAKFRDLLIGYEVIHRDSFLSASAAIANSNILFAVAN